MKVLPLIDLSDLKQATPTVKIQVRKALEEYGCFEAKLDDIPLHVRESVFEAMQQLFDLPSQAKLRNTSDVPYHGYVGQSPGAPLYQSLGIEDTLSPGKIDAFTKLMWPQGNPTFSKSVEEFAEELYEVDKRVRRMVLESLGLGKYEEEHMNSTRYIVRMMKYDAPGGHETKLGIPSHTDKSIISILYQNEARGLELQTKDGEWISAERSPNCFIVMAGEAFHAWTNGRVHAPYHQVMMSGYVDRYSIGVFSSLKTNCIVKAPEEMVDADHPLLFKPFNHTEFVSHRESVKVALKDYYGL